jgi:hypothetical protein
VQNPSPQRKSDANDALGGFAGFHNFTIIVMAAMGADVMGALQLAAIAAFGVGFGAQSQVAAAHAGTRGGGFTFGNGHEIVRLEMISG